MSQRRPISMPISRYGFRLTCKSPTHDAAIPPDGLASYCALPCPRRRRASCSHRCFRAFALSRTMPSDRSGDLRRRGVDGHRCRSLRCGNTHRRPIERDMIAVRIGEEIRGMVVAAPDYLARHKRPTTPRDIGAHNCIRFRFPSGVIIPWQSEKKGEQVEVVVEGPLTVNDPELAIRAARDGVGVLYQASDRKSTRLNSSHQIISYAVFCLKKKTY